MFSLSTLFYLYLLAVNLIDCYIIEPGPQVKATKGGVWPKPQHQTTTDDYYILKPETFQFVAGSQNCDLLEQAFERYSDILHKAVVVENEFYKPWKTDKKFVGYLDTLYVIISAPCNNSLLPSVTMQENYTLTIIADGQNILHANTIWAALRGLETFSQLAFATDGDALQVNCTDIVDSPRYGHRGLLVDTSRHFIPVPKLLKILDGMSYNKMNVFHWHIVDDHSFPYVSSKYPELSAKGAYKKSQVYSSLDVQKVISYAAARGIRVMPEFDTPGHTRSWGVAMPEILTPCYTKNKPDGRYGPIDPTHNFVYSFLKDFLGEVVDIFPEDYVHLGGDETGYECWESNPNIKEFMAAHNWTKYNKLEEYYIQKLVNITNDLNAKSVVWEEVFINGVQLPKSTIVHVWRLPDWEKTMQQVTKGGFEVLLSSCWYLDHLTTGGDWKKYYDCEPTSFGGTEEQVKLILGGEACMWSEVVNEYNIESRIWPRASATAEKLWSKRNADTYDGASKRLEEHTCRMNRRGIGAQPPTGPGFCP